MAYGEWLSEFTVDPDAVNDVLGRRTKHIPPTQLNEEGLAFEGKLQR